MDIKFLDYSVYSDRQVLWNRICPKREEWVYLSNKSYEITSQKTQIFIITTVEVLNCTKKMPKSSCRLLSVILNIIVYSMNTKFMT
jgi:hypothetical protein